MPVQINEMLIRANITEPQQQVGPASSEGGAPSVNKEEIIKECTEKILEIINKRTER